MFNLSKYCYIPFKSISVYQNSPTTAYILSGNFCPTVLSQMLTVLSPVTYKNLIITSVMASGMLNFIALPLAIKSTKYTLGTYKIIMLLFSTSNTLYYIPLIPHPIHYFQQSVIVFYIPGSEDWFKDLLLAIAVQCFALIYVTTIFLEALHFVYRYLLLYRLVMFLPIQPLFISLELNCTLF